MLNLYGLFYIFLFLLSGIVPALASESQNVVPTVAEAKDILVLGWTTGVLGVILIAVGIILAFCGKRFFKVFLAVSGFLSFGVLTANLLSLIDQYIVAIPHHFWVFLICSVVGGLSGAVICFYLWELGVLACAGFGGYCLGVWIMGMRSGGVIEGFLTREAFITVCIILSIVLAWFFDTVAIVITSAIGGALAFVLGVDCFLRWGLLAVILNILLPRDFAKLSKLDAYVLSEIAAVAVVAVLGAVTQFLTGSGKRGYARSDRA